MSDIVWLLSIHCLVLLLPRATCDHSGNAHRAY